jgi:hypothetical protein
MRSKTVWFLATLLLFVPLLAAEAQDVDVPGNITMTDSTGTQGNILKGGVPFLHNFGTDNTFIGSNAGNFTMSGVGNTGTGAGALHGNGMYGWYNTATGYQALFLNNSGYDNTAIGALALRSNVFGDFNTAIGYGALTSNDDGHDNTATGAEALRNNTWGEGNTATGDRALVNNTYGNSNTGTGSGALYSNTAGWGNTASGVAALRNNTIGTDNTASGIIALFNNTTGSNNTATGYLALNGNTTGRNNTAIGVAADVSAGDLTNATAIGNGAVVDASNKIRLGNHDVTVIEGEVGFTASSDVNRKENFEPVEGEEVLTKIRGLSLTSWNFIGHDPKQLRHYGPMAQDFFAAFGRDGIGTIGTETTITSTDIDGILMIAAQALERRTEALMVENADLKARLDALEHRVGNRAR